MKRRTAKRLGWISRAIFTIACIFWVRSTSVSDHWTINRSHPTIAQHWDLKWFTIGTATGQISVDFAHLDVFSPDTPLEDRTHFYHFSHPPSFAMSNLGFHLGSHTTSITGPPGSVIRQLQGFRLELPDWLFMVPGAILIIRTFRTQPREKFPLGHCQTCGYDLRGSLRRCPECGKTAFHPRLK